MTGFTRTLVAVAAVSSAIVAGPSASAGVACGSTFGLVASPNAASGDTILQDADATSPTNAWAVGTGNGAAFALRWDGSTWHQVSVPTIGTRTVLSAVALASPHDIWAVGEFVNSHGKNRSLALHRTTGGWVQVPTPNIGKTSSDLFRISVVGPSDIWATGSSDVQGVAHPLVVHWNGTKWKRFDPPAIGSDDNFMEGLAAVGPGDAWISEQFHDPQTGKDRAATFHFTGSSWHREHFTQPAAGDVDPRDLVAFGPNAVWMAGFYQHSGHAVGLLEQWNGTDWVQSTSDATGSDVFLEAIDGFSAKNVSAVGAFASGGPDEFAFAEHLHGGVWTRVPTDEPSMETSSQMVGAAAATSGSDKRVWAVGWTEINSGPRQSLVQQACP
ncbi:MAG TPA: hypothetical protein VNN79_01855 [Actinomycetota bacterium]|nr:hypothetical protein [Actinomycetota bacterium]